MSLLKERIDPAVLSWASLRGSEFAWPLSKVPEVIEAVQAAGLVNIGGQLQFRFPGATCECYWVEVDVPGKMDSGLERLEQIKTSAVIARNEFDILLTSTDFLAEGRKAFSSQFDAQEAKGNHPGDFMCFVWYAR